MKNTANKKKLLSSFLDSNTDSQFMMFLEIGFILLALCLFVISPASAAGETSVAWTKDIGDVLAADMAEDGSVIYAAVQLSPASSEVYQYDAAGVEQIVFGGISGVVTHLVCTQSGSQAAIATDANIVYYIDSGAITWQQSFSSAITDLDISEVGNVLIVESSVFHKLLSDGSLEYDSSSGTYTGGVIDPDDEFAIVGSSGNVLQKYILSTTDQYWGKTNNNTFNTAFQDYQNLLILYTNETSAIILSNQTLGDDLWNQIYGDLTNPDLPYGRSNIAVSNETLYQTDSTNYFDSIGNITWEEAVTSSAGWSARRYAISWVYDGKMWVGGGYTGSAQRDVWYSTDGVTWTQATSTAGWSARDGACSWVYDGKMWVGGGTSGSNLRDVWYSTDGETWTQATSTAGWSARRYAISWVFDGKMWVGGGNSNTALSDVWYSTDGMTWTQATSAAGWSARYTACSWVYDGKMWVGGGSRGSTYLRDVWYSTDPYLVIQPASVGSTYVFYNYTGNNPQHTQTTYNNAVDFSGTYSLQTKPTLSIYSLQTTKTLTGNISAMSLSDRGDWLGTLTASRLYHDQITSSGFGTDYNSALGGTGTLYDLATANGASMSIVGQGLTTDIYSQPVSRVGTYTAGGAVQHVDIADKNALWAASGGEDGKVYVFSKDASSNWYLEYSSDSEMPITALRMSARGEYVLAGRSGSLTLYQTNTPEVTSTDFWFTLYAYKDSDSYRNAAVNVTQYQGNQWVSYTQGLTDSTGKFVCQVTAGNTYKFDIGNGEKVVIVMASPSVLSQTVSIYTSPISTAIEYNAAWDSSTNSIQFNYTDTKAQTNSVNVKILRTDTWETVYDQTFNNQQSIEETLPIIDDTTSYKVEFSVNRVSGRTRNTFIVSSSRDIVPIPLDPNIKNVLFCGLLFVIAGLFSYLSAIRGAVVVSLTAGFFIYLGWLTIPWEWFVVTVVIAMVAGFTQRRS